MADDKDNNSSQITALIEISQQFLDLTYELLNKGDISKQEYDKLTQSKKNFLYDVDKDMF